jgi:ElaB/YqjD/DUF883 family membrane-anchored ribosome-binding protein
MKESIDHGAEHLDAARSDIGSFVDEVLDLLSGARDRGQEELAQLRERVQGSAQRIKESAAKGQRELRAAAKQADDFAHENPWQVAGVAAVLGLALGVLISRR